MTTLTDIDITDGIKAAAFNYACGEYANHNAARYTSGHAEALTKALGGVECVNTRDLHVVVSAALARFAREEKAPFHEVDFLSVSKSVAARLQSSGSRSNYAAFAKEKSNV